MIETVQALSPAEEEGLRQALVSAVHAFSARWLPSPDAPSSPSTQLAAASKSKEELMHNLWIRAHSKVYATIHRASYALILALHLFGHTPAPPGIVEPNSGDLCLQVSLQHVRTLSSQAHLISQSESSKVVVSNTIDDSFRTDVSPTDYSQMEEIAYWFGIMCDASRSMMKCQPPIVNDSPTSDSKIWDLVRAEVDEFHRKNVHYRNSRVPIPVEVLYGIVGYGNACTSMFWSAISRVQDALFHHRTGISVEEATRVALQEMTRFSKSFEWLLGFVKRDFVLLNEKIRVSCCLLDVDFSLGVMTLVDLLSATSYAHLLPSEYELRLTSARELANSARIAVHLDMTSLGSPLENSILLQSPYPEYIVNAFYRAGMSTIHLYKTKSISLSMVEVSLSLICQGLRILQIVSYAAHSTYKTLQNMCDEVGIKPRPTPAFTTDALLAYESQSFAANGNDMFTRQTVQELDNITTSDNTLLEATIQKHERALGLI
ncbi:MAG: hypothetical protein M1820_002801 [Bogoriella megaspora]|nr:MAG: hypothetical protein M1820_002801 [Bogoriella megaspora]